MKKRIGNRAGSKRSLRWSILLLALLMLLGGCKSQDQMEEPQTTATQTEEEMNSENNILIKAEDVVNYTAEQIRAMETTSGKEAAVTIDVVCMLCSDNFQRSDVRSIMRSIRNAGIRRVYMIMCSPSYPVMSGGMITAIETGLAGTDVVRALRNLKEDPNKVFIEVCHEFGLEAIAVIKPYEGGGGVTIPEGTTLDAVASEFCETFAPETVGGHRAFIDRFIAKHPEMRVKRKAGTGETAKGPVKAMEIYYQIGSDHPDPAVENGKEINAPTVWVSRDNATYEIWKKASWAYDLVNNYAITDPNGIVTSRKNCVRLRVELQDLPEEYGYVACSLSEQSFIMAKGDYWCRPYSMTKLYGADGELPSTLGYYVRTPYDQNATPETMKWGAYGSPADPTKLKGIRVDASGAAVGVYKDGSADNGAHEFYQWGFEYEFVYTSAVVSGFMSPVIALGVGKNEFVQGTLCEAYEEVRAYWLEQVEAALSYGADGIDIRWDGHSSMVSDYYYYGYNEPIAAEYLKQYGKRLEDEPVNTQTATRVMSIRGEFFVKFLEEASALAHSKGAIFLSHFFATSYTSDIASDSYVPSASANQAAQWKMPKIIVRDYQKVIDLCDEIVYKDYFSVAYSLSDQRLGRVLTEYARSKGKKIWVHCYVQQNGGMLSDGFMENFLSSEAADGVILYEIVESYDYGETAQMLKKHVDNREIYQISAMDRISGIPQGTTAGELIERMGMLGSCVVVDASGASVSLSTPLAKDMKLCLNGTIYFNLSLKG